MKVAITASGTDLQAAIDPRFGRAQNFIIVETDTMEFEVISNSHMNTAHGAGIQAGQLMSTNDVQVLITGQVGPNAFQTLSAAGIQLYTSQHQTVAQAIDAFKAGQLKQIAEAGIPHAGMGRNR